MRQGPVVLAGVATRQVLMPTIQVASLPPGALLHAYAAADAYTDCFAVKLGRPVSLADFMLAFYTTPVFRIERWLLGHLARFPSTDIEARQLAQGHLSRFAAWQVEAREPNQAVLAAGRTRSWLMVMPGEERPGSTTTLFFGSAVVSRRHGGLGWPFTALLGLHKLYSRILLAAAARRLASGQS